MSDLEVLKERLHLSEARDPTNLKSFTEALAWRAWCQVLRDDIAALEPPASPCCEARTTLDAIKVAMGLPEASDGDLLEAVRGMVPIAGADVPEPENIAETFRQGGFKPPPFREKWGLAHRREAPTGGKPAPNPTIIKS